MERLKYIGKSTSRLTNRKVYEVIRVFTYSDNFRIFTIVNDKGNDDQYTTNDKFVDGASEYRNEVINGILS